MDMQVDSANGVTWDNIGMKIDFYKHQNIPQSVIDRINKRDYFRIGEISKITGISIKMLRYYDKINLCKPSYIDEDNSYRYYTLKEINLLTVIKELKNHNFTSPEIKALFENNDFESIEKHYLAKLDEVKSQIDELNSTKDRIENQLALIKTIFETDRNGENQKDIIIKNIEERKVLSTDACIKITLNNILLLINEAQNFASKSGLKISEPYMLIIKDIDSYTDGSEKINLEACVCLASKLPRILPFIKVLKKGKYLSYKYCADFGSKNISAYLEMVNYARKNSLEIIGDPIFIYLNNIQNAISEGKVFLELQIPVK